MVPKACFVCVHDILRSEPNFLDITSQPHRARAWRTSQTEMFSKPFSSDYRRTSRSRGQTLYFAYGSNLSFEQIAIRCPGSRFVGRACLYNYRFQINERGFANVIRTDSPQNWVEGLCYRLTKDDEVRLDHSEGVPTAYQKELLEIEFFPAAAELLGRDVTDILRYRPAPEVAPGSHFEDPSQIPKQPPTDSIDSSAPDSGISTTSRFPLIEPISSHSTTGEFTKAMVYLSTRYVQDGQPWDEYIERMESGILEAASLGISWHYFEQDVLPSLQIGRGVRNSQPEAHPSRHNNRAKRSTHVRSSSVSRNDSDRMQSSASSKDNRERTRDRDIYGRKPDVEDDER